jgi:hypothetical protein
VLLHEHINDVHLHVHVVIDQHVHLHEHINLHDDFDGNVQREARPG